ncbi:acylphosphatase [Chitinimonas sp. BJB300]|uniref:acylphosphatase n=1 Tax=Chitinimonas sp. BJB300 TaxID=1559339 RepID=UPI000C0C9B41|nr:acylphosphatase [Chitinimonas sp. BJB300]PHV10480.1 acylphosphatase [Chitinimonas sp. BJB300]TSJ87119.1 acylphosphatase [Chitinimonas sp. BJB300]
MTTRHLLIHGRVQGVGYRYALEAMAHSLHLHGWVRNRLDGTVEAVLQGPEESVAALIAWAKQGPPTADVSKVDVEDHPSIEQRGFLRQPTA